MKVHVTRDFRMMRSPTLIGCRNCRPSTAAVTSRLRVCRWQAMAPGDVDEVHHRAAEDVPERVRVVRQHDLHHFGGGSAAGLGVRSTRAQGFKA